MNETLVMRPKHGTQGTFLYSCDDCGEKFEYKISCDMHRIRTHAELITVLPPKLVKNIFELLHPHDMVNLSQTCHKYKDFIAEHFEQKRQCGWITIHIGRGIPEFSLDRDEKYEIYFRSFIRNIKIMMRTSAAIISIHKKKLFEKYSVADIRFRFR